MKLNESYYGNSYTLIQYDGVKLIDKVFNTDNYSLNQKLDDSITVSASTAKFAPFNNISYYSRWTSNIGENEKNTNDLQQIGMAYGSYKIYNDYQYYVFRWGNDRGHYNGATGYKMIGGYKYLQIQCNIKCTVGNGNTEKFLSDVTSSDVIRSVFVEFNGNHRTSGEHDFNIFPVGYLKNTQWLKTGDNFEIKNDDYLFYTAWLNRSFGASYSYSQTIIGFDVLPNQMTTLDNWGEQVAFRVFNADLCEITNNGSKYDCVVKATKEQIMAICATLGFVFTPTSEIFYDLYKNTSEVISNDNLYIPTIENGLYNGKYTHGADNLNQTQIKDNWNDDIDAPFKNGVSDFSDIDKNEYADSMKRGSGRQAGVFNNIYAVNESSLKQLQKILNVVDSEDAPPEIYKNMKFMGNNPMNCITSINWFPFPIMRGGSTNIIIGSTTTNIPAFECAATATTIDMGFCDIKPIHKDHKFLNFEPYSYYFLYIPFCGWSQLDSRKIYENNIHIYMNIDYLSGVLQAEIWINDTLEKTIEGVASNPVSIQATDLTSYQNSRFNSVFNAISSVGSMATGNVVGGAVGLSQNLANFLLTPINYNDAKAITAMLSTYMPTSPCILRYSVSNTEPSNYGNSIGYACEFSDTVNNLSGYTVINNFNTSGITATDTEKQLIKTIAENGFYI